MMNTRRVTAEYRAARQLSRAPQKKVSARTARASARRAHSMNAELARRDVLFYIVFARHSQFLHALLENMLDNVCEYYSAFPRTVHALGYLRRTLREKPVAHRHKVVVFFFLLSIDTRMRHWLLGVELAPGDRATRDALLKRNFDLVPGGRGCLSTALSSPFLGQSVRFAPLDPHTAAGVLLPTSQEQFFVPAMSEDPLRGFDRVAAALKHLVSVA